MPILHFETVFKRRNYGSDKLHIKNSDKEQVKVLNLFAYTGAATVACLKEGASVVHVDASKGMTNWAKENAEASGVADGDVRWIVDDCIKNIKNSAT